MAPEAADTVAAAGPDDIAVALRHAVLSGRFFGQAHGDAAGALAAFLAEPPSLRGWFGDSLPERWQADAGDRDWLIRGAIDRDIAAIDALISAQLDAILHHTRLRRLEGLWRALHWLVEDIEPAARVRVRIVNLGWSEICRDLERAAEFDQSHLFKLIYEGDFGIAGGEPYGLLVVDHEVRHRPGRNASTDDVSALASLAGVAAAAFAPVVIAASPTLLDVGAFSELTASVGPAAPLRGPEHARWRSLAGREDARFVAVALPRLLARPPWEDDPARVDGFRYREHAADSEQRVWMTAGFGFAQAVVRAYASSGWPADIRGAETDRLGGGVVDALPIEPFRTDTEGVWHRPPLDLVLTDRQERSLVDGGLMPISALPFVDAAVFGATRSLQAPASYIGQNAAAANANARISAQINSILCVSRFAHYVKVLGRDMVGSVRTHEEVERELQAWLNGYINTNQSAGSELRLRYPLVGGRVSVRERPGKPGVYGCVIHLQPHFQLDDVAATFRLVTDIVAPGGARS